MSVRTYDTINIPEFNFTVDNNTSTSVVYEFRVTPINGAGNGNTSAPVTGYFSEREFSAWKNSINQGTSLRCSYPACEITRTVNEVTHYMLWQINQATAVYKK